MAVVARTRADVETLAEEIAGIPVIADLSTAGGVAATDRLMEMVAKAADAQGQSPQEFADRVLGGRIPQGRVGRADEVARTIVFAASEASGFTNASQLYVDGGSAAKI